jgi:hypothetical protein
MKSITVILFVVIAATLGYAQNQSRWDSASVAFDESMRKSKKIIDNYNNQSLQSMEKLAREAKVYYETARKGINYSSRMKSYRKAEECLFNHNWLAERFLKDTPERDSLMAVGAALIEMVMAEREQLRKDTSFIDRVEPAVLATITIIFIALLALILIFYEDLTKNTKKGGTK